MLDRPISTDRNISPPRETDIPITFRINRSAAEWILFGTSSAGVLALAFVAARGTWALLDMRIFTSANLHPDAPAWLSGFACCTVLFALTWIMSKVAQ